MPCTSIVVLQQSTHTYVIKLRGSGTILAIVTPNADQHKGPHQSRSKPTLALHKCSPALEITALRSRVQTNVIGPCWSHLAFVIISVQSHLLSVLAFLWMMSADGWWWEFNGGKDKGVTGHFGVTAKMLRIVYMCASACEVVCARLRANVDDCVRGWVITVVFSALWGGSDGCDGWLAVWPPSSRLSPARRLEIWAGVEGCWGWMVGGEHVSPLLDKGCLHLKKKKKAHTAVLFRLNSM